MSQVSQELLEKRAQVIGLLGRLNIAYPEMVWEGMIRGVLAETLLIAAILREGGILKRRCYNEWKNSVKDECFQSDPIFQLKMFLKGRVVRERLDRYGIDASRFWLAERRFEEYTKVMESDGIEVKFHAELKGVVQEVLEAIRQGFKPTPENAADPLSMRLVVAHRPTLKRRFDAHNGIGYMLDDDSIVTCYNNMNNWVVGELYHIRDRRRRGVEFDILRFATVVTEEWILSNLSDLVTLDAEGISYDPVDDRVVGWAHYRLCNAQLNENSMQKIEGQSAHFWFKRWLVNAFTGRTYQSGIPEKLKDLIQHNYGLHRIARLFRTDRLSVEYQFMRSEDDIESWIGERIGRAENLAQVEDSEKLRFPMIKDSLASVLRSESQFPRLGGVRVEARSSGVTVNKSIVPKDVRTPEQIAEDNRLFDEEMATMAKAGRGGIPAKVARVIAEKGDEATATMGAKPYEPAPMRSSGFTEELFIGSRSAGTGHSTSMEAALKKAIKESPGTVV